jgi:hypothetical protein
MELIKTGALSWHERKLGIPILEGGWGKGAMITAWSDRQAVGLNEHTFVLGP